jgi:tripartite-type tricarboxylate transporter receptor subunit TctC
MYAPARTPSEVVTRLNKVIVDALRRPEVRERLLALGLYATGTSPQELATVQRADSELWAPAIKASGFTAKQ